MDYLKLIEKTIISIDNTYPNDSLITTYKEFLLQKEFLSCYQFNPVVFDNLLSLANTLWTTNTRISRIDLVIKLRQYLCRENSLQLKDYQTRPYSFTQSLSLDTRKQLFLLFKNTIIESKYVTAKQIEVVRGIANNLLINVGLTEEEETWLCSNVQQYPYLLNRILRYPQKSTVISCWAKENYSDTLYVTRRAELIGWILDENPSFEVNIQRLLDDFEIINQLDKEAIKTYRDDIYANEVIERDLGDILPRKTFTDFETGSLTEGGVDLERPVLKLIRRPYGYPIDMNSGLFMNIPDFKKMTKEFYEQIDLFKKKTMIWSIGYSRLDNSVKTELFKKYYSVETVNSILYIAKKTGNSEILKWIISSKEIL